MGKDPNREYFEFYLMGRDEAQGDFDDEEIEIDAPALGKRVLLSMSGLTAGSGPNIREVAMVAAKDIATKRLVDLATWKAGSRRLRKEIELAGGDAALAHRMFGAGFRDELAISIENEILSAIADAADGDDDEGDEPDADDDSTSDDD